MQQLIYVLQFKGHLTLADPSEDVGYVEATAESSAIRTTITDSGLDVSIEKEFDSHALFASQFTAVKGATGNPTEGFTTRERFMLAEGSVIFGEEHRLLIQNTGLGFITANTIEPAVQHGVVTYQVTEGKGQFQGATGFITSNFVLTKGREIIDNHLGVVFIRS